MMCFFRHIYLKLSEKYGFIYWSSLDFEIYFYYI